MIGLDPTEDYEIGLQSAWSRSRKTLPTLNDVEKMARRYSVDKIAGSITLFHFSLFQNLITPGSIAQLAIPLSVCNLTLTTALWSQWYSDSMISITAAPLRVL